MIGRMVVKAKRDIEIERVDHRSLNFLAGKEYRCMKINDDLVLSDENHCGYLVQPEELMRNFEVVD